MKPPPPPKKKKKKKKPEIIATNSFSVNFLNAFIP